MMENTEISKIRREYLLRELDESNVHKDPYEQFSLWMEETIKAGVTDPSAMILATSSKESGPSARVVLLKGVDKNGLIFYTNYSSRKAKDLEENPAASVLFFWKELERQVRISGKTEKVSNGLSEEYFHSRPYESQLGAWASEQSSVISGRDFLEKKFEEYKNKFKGEEIPLPPFWGGYMLRPERWEFWQGRENRLHDRVCYLKEKDTWKIVRLAP